MHSRPACRVTASRHVITLFLVLQFNPTSEILGRSVVRLGEEPADVVAGAVGGQVGVDDIEARVDVGEVRLAVVKRG